MTLLIYCAKWHVYSGFKASRLRGTKSMVHHSRFDWHHLASVSRSTLLMQLTWWISTSKIKLVSNYTHSQCILFIFRVSPDFYYERDIILYKKEINAFLLQPKEELNFTHDFPWSATVSDQDSGLNVALRSDNNSGEWWCSKYEGFRYFIHGTNELLSSTNRFQLQFGELTELLIKPKMTITEEDLRDYSLERWGCVWCSNIAVSPSTWLVMSLFISIKWW